MTLTLKLERVIEVPFKDEKVGRSKIRAMKYKRTLFA